MILTLPYPPSLNALYRTWRGRVLLSREGRDYKHKAALLAKAAGLRCVCGPVAITLRIYRPAKRGDLDNTLKALLDSLNGVLWNDDSQVVGIEAWRYDDKANPRVELRMEALPQAR